MFFLCEIILEELIDSEDKILARVSFVTVAVRAIV